MNLKIEQEIPDERISDLLSCAFEGGSRFWAQFGRMKQPKGKKIEFATDLPMAGGMVEIADMEEDEKVHELTKEKVETGLKVMAAKYPQHFADFLAENEDAITGDVFLQCCLFGETIYA